MTVKLRPISFRDDMVEAILRGDKKVTRRKIELQPERKLEPWKISWVSSDGFEYQDQQYSDAGCMIFLEPDESEIQRGWHCKYGKIGDLLYVKETFGRTSDGQIYHKAGFKGNAKELGIKWYGSRFMPKDASRLTLEITGLECQKLHDITQEEALLEGVRSVNHFQDVWDDMYYTSNYAWAANPFVWVVRFNLVGVKTWE